MADALPRRIDVTTRETNLICRSIYQTVGMFGRTPWVLQLAVNKLLALRNASLSFFAGLLPYFLAPVRIRRLSKFDQRIFTVRKWHIVLASALLFKVAQRVLRQFFPSHRVRDLKARMESAETYEEWMGAARELDQLDNCVEIRDHTGMLKVLQDKANQIEKLIQEDDVHGLMWMLRQDTTRNVGNFLSRVAETSTFCCLLPPTEIENYVEQLTRALHHVCHCPLLSLEERLGFVRELRHAYGRTGLTLSGGGSFGHWHFGVTRSLFHAGLLPRVLSGSSAGSIGAAMLGTRTEAELAENMDQWANLPDTDFFGAPKGFKGAIKHFFSKGTLHSAEEYILRLKRLMGDDLTFQEAYVRSGRVLNIAVVAYDTHEPCRVLNYLTAPNVLVWSAVACSSAFPFLFAPQELLVKDAFGHIVPHHQAVCSGAGEMGLNKRRWCDGSLEEDLPMRSLGELFGVNYFLVSQCNPWLLPVLAITNVFPPKASRLVEFEIKHRCGQLLAIFPRNKLLKLVCQPWRGDLNFVLPLTTFSFFRSAVNFTSQEIVKAMRAGQRSVWAKLPAIRASCAVEVAIDAELRSLTMQSKALKRREEHALAISSRIRASIPSWLDLKSLGLGTSESMSDFTTTGATAPKGENWMNRSGYRSIVGGSAGNLNRFGLSTMDPSSQQSYIVHSSSERLQEHADDFMEQIEPWEVSETMMTTSHHVFRGPPPTQNLTKSYNDSNNDNNIKCQQSSSNNCSVQSLAARGGGVYLERGLEAWKDVTALFEGLDSVAP